MAFKWAYVVLLALIAAQFDAALAEVTVLTEENFASTVEDSPKVFFVKFFAPWCGHCKRLAPTWEELSGKVKDSVVIAHVDCTESRDLCEKHEIRGYPTLKVFAKGKESQSYSGSRELEALKAFIEDIADSKDD